MINIRILMHEDYYEWLDVYRFYAEHYQIELTNDGVLTTWGWLMDSEHPLTGIVAEIDNNLIGVAHYREIPSPLRGKNLGFLDDLIVKPEKRGTNTATLLMNKLKSIGLREKWPTIRWITKDDNYRARSLYDKVAKKTNWAIYEMDMKD